MNIFKRNVSKQEAEEVLRTAKMRRSLFELLWQKTSEHSDNAPPRPMPMLDDDQIKDKLKDILGL